MTDLGGSAALPSKKPAIVLGVVLALVAVAAVVTVLLTRGTDDGADWNAYVGVDTDAGELVLYDEDGEEVERIDAGLEEPAFAAARGRWVLVQTYDGAEAAVVDVVEGEVVWSDEIEDVAHWVDGTSAPLLVSGAPAGGEVRLVDPRSDTDLELGAEAGIAEPLIVPDRVVPSPDGTILAAATEGGDESVVVDVDAGEAHAVDGYLLAVSDDGVATSAGDDDGATLRFFDRSGEEQGTAPLPSDVTGLVMTAATEVVGVSRGDDGTRSFRIGAGDDEPETIEELDLDVAWARALPGSGRILVSGDGESVLLDADGEVVGDLDGEATYVYGYTGDPDCVALRLGNELVIYDLESAEERDRGEVGEQGPVQGSVDGCVVGSQGAVIGAEDPVEVPEDALVWVAPDGTAVLVQRDDRTTIIDLTDPDADPIEIEGRVTGFVER